MKEFKNQAFEELRFSDAEVIDTMRFDKCSFIITVLSKDNNLVPESRTRLNNLYFKNCTINGRGSSQQKAYLEDVTFENMKVTADVLRLSGTIFNRVIFKGNFDRIVLSSSHNGIFYLDENCELINADEEKAIPLNQYAENEYKAIEWALDISQAEFSLCEIRESIPAHLIKRNPETQMLLKYDKVAASNWENNEAIQGSYAHYFCRRVLKSGKDRVIVAPIRNKKDFAIEMEAIKILKEEGIAELD